ncbi:hypothetical protein Kpho02_20290 [Kitasatospora phosalacinea]|uniref:Uncharacterized protein n=1 Tax=Kitasatospora phosalacinea TaxID=2065 RepID=A0A9W6Q4E2_9ACTN|nr:hypothetical protein [Kitasatospora phosalacinea]GLW69730.1 hypothetical protein Kpho02_20290 [Kitasatospora phosalacinea]
MGVALPHPEGVPRFGLLVLTVLVVLMCGETALRGSGPAREHPGSAGLVAAGAGIRPGSPPPALVGCAVTATGLGPGNWLRRRGRRRPDVRHPVDRRR